MQFIYLTAIPQEKNAIYIKTNSVLLVNRCNTCEGLPKGEETLIDVLLDNGYTIKKSSLIEWEYNIESGKSFEIFDIEELNEFKNVNAKANKIRNGQKI